MTAVQVETVSRRFGEFVAVDGVSFCVESGEVVAVLGPNGAGKTTMIEMLEGVSGSQLRRNQGAR